MRTYPKQTEQSQKFHVENESKQRAKQEQKQKTKKKHKATKDENRSNKGPKNKQT